MQAEKAVADAELRQLTGRRTMTPDEINTMVEAMSGIAAILRAADPVDKAKVYQELGLRLTYEHGPRKIKAEANLSGSCTKVCPRSNTNQNPTGSGPVGVDPAGLSLRLAAFLCGRSRN